MSAQNEAPSQSASPDLLPRRSLFTEQQVIWTVWLAYGAFYFCRANISTAVTGMQEEFGFSKRDIGLILGALKLTYGLGQFITGQLAERYPARLLLGIGMLTSAVLNVLFGFGTGFYFLLFVWGANGFAQSLGWTPCIRVIADWFPLTRRGMVLGIVGTSYQLIGALTLVIAGEAVVHFDSWRAAFYVPAALLGASSIVMLLFLRESPNDDEDDPPDTANPGAPPVPRSRTFVRNIRITLQNPALWLLATALFFLNACRYGYLDWGVKHLEDVLGKSVDKAAFDIAAIPLGGILGAIFSGWATDRFFGGRRAPVICMLLVALAVLTVMYDPLVRTSGITGTAVLMVAVGFTIFGAQVLLVGTAPADLARAGTSAAAAGFVNFMGYMGAFGGDFVTGWVVDKYDWTAAVALRAAWAVGAAIAVAFLWNARGYSTK